MSKFSTRYKVAAGYILLTLLLITTMGYVYRIMNGIGGKGDRDELLSARRSITSEVMNDLNRAEIVVQAIAIGKTNEYDEYKEIMSSVDRAIDSLQNITDDLQNSDRLKTIRMFINMKNNNMSHLMTIISSNDITKLYTDEINAIISLQDSLLAHSGKLRYPHSVADTISTRLKNIRFKVSADYSEQADKLNSQMQSLRLSSLLLNDEVRMLLNEIEEEEQLLEQARIKKNEKVRNRAYMIISAIAVVSILLAAWFMYFISRDITRSNHYRSELEKSKQRAEELLNAKEQLMLTITHDIKAPVGAIIGYAELLGNIITGERQQFYLQNMQGSANHLLQLVNSLLDFHRLDADKMDRQRVPFNVKELFDSIMNSYRPVAANKNIQLVGRCDNELDNIFKGDPLRIRQIIENLVGNAFKFTSEGAVTVEASFDDTLLRITVSDTGCGIAEEDLNRLFKEFTRRNIITGERQQFYLQNMQGSANHLLQLVNSLLDFHRLDADKMDRQRVPFNVKELFDSIMNSYRPVAANKNIQLVGRCDNELDNIFKGDPLRIRQIIENLVGNAFKFTSEGAVTVEASFDDTLLRITVSDTGCGIAEEDLNRLFKEFTRLKNAQGKEGFGLGLAITNKLVHLLGGEINVKSEVGVGTTFEVTLPLECTSDSLSSKEPNDNDAVVANARLLLIDDDPLQLSMMEAMLKHPSLSVTVCGHPDELFIYLQQQQYDVIITDIQMPAMNGIDLINKIKEFPGAGNVPVIAMTARSDMNTERLSHYGFATCLHKPFTGKELLQVIAGVVYTGGKRFDFGQLTAFSMDDAEAKAEIMRTFVVETKKKRELLSQACNGRDMATVTMITHQLLPLFVMVGAVAGKDNLEWFEKRREETEYPDEADARIKAILDDVDTMIDEAEKEIGIDK